MEVYKAGYKALQPLLKPEAAQPKTPEERIAARRQREREEQADLLQSVVVV